MRLSRTIRAHGVRRKAAVGARGQECRTGMWRRPWVWERVVGRLGVAVLLGGWLWTTAVAQTEADIAAGKQLYTERCAHCHGETGDGKGVSAAVVYPKPRDFTSGLYKFRTRYETS